jgi:MFS family permease
MCVITMLPSAYPTWKPQIQGLLMLGMIIGTILAELTCSGTLSDYLVYRLSRGITANRIPEMRLWLFIPAAALSALGLIIFGVAERFAWHWAIALFGSGLFAYGVQAGNTTVAAYTVDCYPDEVMSIVAFYSVHLNLSAFASPFWIVPMVNKMGWAWAFGTQAIITFAVAAVFIPSLLIWGKGLRGRRGPLTLK